MCRLRICIQIYCACAFYCIQRCSHTVFRLAFQATVPIKLERELNRGSNCSPSRAMYGRIMSHGIISSCQSAVSSEIVKRCCSNLISSAITSTQTFYLGPERIIDRYQQAYCCSCCFQFAKKCLRLCQYATDRNIRLCTDTSRDLIPHTSTVQDFQVNFDS